MYSSIYNFKNLLIAYRQACKNNRYKISTLKYSLYLENYLFDLEKKLLTETYKPQPYRQFVVTEPKRRKISAPEFEDRIVGNLLSDLEADNNTQSSSVEYEIVGVTPDEKTPVFYVPFIDLRSLGIENYSQVKIEVDNDSNLNFVRRQIEAMGYSTSSVTDTVSQINSLFSTLRTILALLGFMALLVAALGMFNTLTVSLMERTHEVGLMKAMGMKSYEVKDLFMAESLIMGISGGICGIALGFILGKFLSLVISSVSIFKGLGFIDVSYIPFIFVLIILLLSLIIGIFTGIYPAKRSTKISALNALRYE